MKTQADRTAFRTAVLYLAFSAAWILFSDFLVTAFLPSQNLSAFAQTIKGLFFICLTAILLFIVLRQDLRRNQQAQDALQESEIKFRLLFEKSVDPNLLLDLDQVLDCNQSALDLMGATRKEQIIGQDPASFSPEHQPGGEPSIDKFHAVVETAFQEGSHRFEWVHSNLMGETLTVDVALTLINMNGKPVLYATWRDLTTRKQMEEALREQKERYRLLFQRTPAGIFHFDCDLNITEINERMLEIAQVSAGTMLNMDLHNLYDPSLLPALNAALKGVEGEYEGTYHATTSPSSLWVSFRTAPLYDQNHKIQGGIAILEDITRRKQAEIEQVNAYEATLEGWVHLLEIRDQETKGHSTRVTQLTEELARKMGFPEEELVHIRRGALLHDIGKFSVPDSILLKPGKLTAEEWQIMQQHPVKAYQVLSTIPYLHPAMDIPYCHHERWDGSGYPRGLKGESIPLEARLFTVVDVWDALLKDRPYRQAWPQERVIEYLRAESSKQFDPQVVDIFLQLLGETSTPAE